MHIFLHIVALLGILNRYVSSHVNIFLDLFLWSLPLVRSLKYLYITFFYNLLIYRVGYLFTMSGLKRTAILLFRNDLRLHDNPALSLANSSAGTLLALFICVWYKVISMFHIYHMYFRMKNSCTQFSHKFDQCYF